jgi:hypothetical protein
MIEHGIWTTKADYWLHLFPLENVAFLYRPRDCREFIEEKKLPVIFGRSKDPERSVTGAGYLIRCDTFFIRPFSIPSSYLTHVDWEELTDRECGVEGQRIAEILMALGIILVPFRTVEPTNSKTDQLASKDVRLVWREISTIEIKSERPRTRNLFVQRGERDHRVHIAPDGSERITEFSPRLIEGAGS